MDMYQIFCMFVDRLYQTSTKQFLFDHLKAILHISELDLLWVSFRGLPVDCLVYCHDVSIVWIQLINQIRMLFKGTFIYDAVIYVNFLTLLCLIR